ncbi:MAG: hypothetical protein NVS4B2_23370 [Chloroflexota bacterium]
MVSAAPSTLLWREHAALHVLSGAEPPPATPRKRGLSGRERSGFLPGDMLGIANAGPKP